MGATEHVPGTLTVGIDLASQPRETGVCIVDWGTSPARVLERPSQQPTDDVLIALMVDPAMSKVAIDAPFGWPLAFIDAISTYRDRAEWLDLEPNEMRFRATDMQVAELTGQTPLSVAMSDLAWPAMRCARLLSGLADEHGPLDRGGSGRFAEVYPAAALRRWGLIAPRTSASAAAYKGSKPGRRDRREEMMALLLDRLVGVVSMTEAALQACVEDDDDLDAFVSALVARALDIGLTDPIPHSLRWAALREGWIHLPATDSLERLGG